MIFPMSYFWVSSRITMLSSFSSWPWLDAKYVRIIKYYSIENLFRGVDQTSRISVFFPASHGRRRRPLNAWSWTRAHNKAVVAVFGQIDQAVIVHLLS